MKIILASVAAIALAASPAAAQMTNSMSSTTEQANKTTTEVHKTTMTRPVHQVRKHHRRHHRVVRNRHITATVKTETH